MLSKSELMLTIVFLLIVALPLTTVTYHLGFNNGEELGFKDGQTLGEAAGYDDGYDQGFVDGDEGVETLFLCRTWVPACDNCRRQLTMWKPCDRREILDHTINESKDSK